MAGSILNVNSFKAALMLFPVLDHTDSSPVPATSHHDNIPDVELDEVDNLIGLQIQLDGVVSLDKGVRVADSAAIIGVKVRNAFLSKLHGTDLAELVLQSKTASKGLAILIFV